MWFVDLVPVTDPAMVGSAVAAALGLGEQQGRSIDDSVLAALADRHALLVLDNCEHLSGGVAPFVERLLARCPRVSVLTTSRARLLVPFEWVYSVPPLSLDGHDSDSDVGSSDAVALFVDRAAAVGWTLEPEHLGRVAEVCRKLGGGVGDRARRGPPAGTRSRRARRGSVRPPAAPGRRTPCRRAASLGAGHARLEPGPAQPSGPDPAAAGLDLRVAVHRLGRRPGGRVPASGTGRGRRWAGPTRRPEPARRRRGGGRHLYRALETIRQYGTEQLTQTGELAATRAHHLRWCGHRHRACPGPVARHRWLAGQVRCGGR